jgi:zinc protease
MQTLLRVAAVAALTAGAGAAASAAPKAAPPSISARDIAGASAIRALTLANGLRIVVWSDHDIPNVALYNFVRVGSRNEAPGITGLAHFFEHMMFNGTPRRPQGQFDTEMSGQGGSNNAFTSDNMTVYQDWFPRTGLATVFDLESDRLQHLAFDPKVVESERNVVYSERRLRVEDNNEAFLAEQVQATAFVAHPYQIPTIGWPSDIRSWKLADLQKFFHTYYAPNNCTLVVVGDVEADQVFTLAKQYFEGIPRQEVPPAVTTQEPEQLGEKRVAVERRAQTPLLQIAYKAPAATDPTGPAVNLLMTILGEGDSSRLHRALVEQQKLAISANGYWAEGFDPSLAWFFFALPEGAQVAPLERAVDEELARVAAQGITAAELQRAKNLAVSGFWKSISTIDGKARMLGEYEVMHGDYHKLFSAPALYDAVTREQVQAVARSLLQKAHRTVGVLQPAAEPAGPSAAPAASAAPPAAGARP